MLTRTCVVAGTVALTAALLAAPGQTALDRYVAAPDPNYAYELVSVFEDENYTASILDMTSQSWRTTKDVDRNIWKHWVTIIRPKNVRSDAGLLFITGGSNNSRPPQFPEPLLAATAVATGTVVTELRMVPNQPIVFRNDGKARFEDDLIAYSWDKYLRGGDEEWLPRLPMTKAAVRAMDTITDFSATPRGGNVKVNRFVVAGASKRGWTTWTTAAVDRRVIGIIPMVIDMLNIQPSFEHHWRVYGFWAPAVQDYVNMGIMEWARSPRYQQMMKIVEPYEYRDRLTMPKFMVNATGDQFFIPDSWQFYWGDLKGEKYIRYVPNADHSLRRSDAAQSVEAYYTALIENQPRPKFDWNVEKNGTIRVRTETPPEQVMLWQATNPEARDFRLETIGPSWKQTLLAPVKPGVYEAKVQPPAKGYTAYMIELTFPGTGRFPLKFTTGVKVTPDTLPCPPFQPKQRQ
jgi:PhoPQ-activated pathogenicity-related protein